MRLGRGWNAQAELLAVIAELIDQGNRLTFGAHFKGRAPKPIQIRRPGDRDLTKPDPQALKGFMAQRGIPIVRGKRKKDKRG